MNKAVSKGTNALSMFLFYLQLYEVPSISMYQKTCISPNLKQTAIIETE